MLNAPPKNAGTQSGLKLPIQPKCRKRMYSGAMITGKGIIIVTSTRTNTALRPRHRSRENP